MATSTKKKRAKYSQQRDIIKKQKCRTSTGICQTSTAREIIYLMYLYTLGAAIGYSSGKNSSSLKTPPTERRYADQVKGETKRKSILQAEHILFKIRLQHHHLNHCPTKPRKFRRAKREERCKHAYHKTIEGG